MGKRQIIINAIMAILQVIIIAVTLFILYGYLLRTLGAGQLGLWSVVLATTSLTQIANFGFSGGILKFVAKYSAREDEDRILEILQTAAVTVAILVAVILAAGYPLAGWLLKIVLPSASVRDAMDILPFAFVALWLATVAAIFQSGIDGLRRIDLRAAILIFANLVHLGLCVLLAPKYRLMGLAYAKIIENGLLLIGSWAVLKKRLPSLPVLLWKWKSRSFSEMASYSLSFQAVSAAGMLYDPITKGLLSMFSNLYIVGYYEMASRMVQQIRLVIVSAVQVLVPEIANLQEKSPERIFSVYRLSSRLVSYFALPLFTAIGILAPSISVLWLGYNERTFTYFAAILSAGWFINTLSTPAYFAYLGIGSLRWNVLGHVSIAVMNAIGGLLLGKLLGGYGVGLAWVIALSSGSLFIALSFIRQNGCAVMDIVPKENRMLLLACFLTIPTAVILTRFAYSKLGIIAYSALLVMILALFILWPLWRNPMRKMMQEWLLHDLLKVGETN